MTQSQNRKIAEGALFAALALIFSYIELLIPIPLPVPGLKIGFANIVIIVVLYRLGAAPALWINLIRIFTAGLLFTGLFGAMYSLGGGLLSLAIMAVAKKTGWFSIVGVSMAGGVFHNIGQLTVAALVLGDLKVFAYMPVLTFAGIGSGIIIGFISFLILSKLPAVKVDDNN